MNTVHPLRNQPLNLFAGIFNPGLLHINRIMTMLGEQIRQPFRDRRAAQLGNSANLSCIEHRHDAGGDRAIHADPLQLLHHRKK